MKNMKISVKLILSFVIVAILAGIAGGVGIFGIQSLKTSSKSMYDYNLVAIEELGNMREALQRQRVVMRDALINVDDISAVNSSYNDCTERVNLYNKARENYQTTVTTQEDTDLIKKIDDLYASFSAARESYFNTVKAQNPEESKAALEITKAINTELMAKMDEATSMNSNAAASANEKSANTATLLTTIQLVVVVFAVFIALVLGVYISKLISNPVIKMMKAADGIAVGDMNVDAEYVSDDEVGALAKSFGKMIDGINVQISALERIANGDLTVEIAPRCDRDTMGVAIVKMVDNLNNMFSDINSSTVQVSDGAKQIADGAQSLAQGSTEQAAAVEQLSASISEVATKTKENAEKAGNAASLGNTIKSNAEKGNEQMAQMMQAVREINEASQSINNVIKVIDDIAFQTNILALNAAVEAARAGQHGKGFAVVAEEVRNLAGKSAEAAKNTSSLIANSIEKAEFGAKVAAETAESLADIVSGINESSKIVSDISVSSEEQNLAIAQINKGIDQVAQVVQQNSATAEESAAASEEMSGQSNMLQELVAQFKLKGSSSRRMTSPKSSSSKPRQLTMPAPSSSPSPNDFGKY